MTSKIKLAAAIGVVLAVIVGTPATASVSKGETATRFALAQVGDRYVWGARGPFSWDCSSLVQAAWRRAGKWIPRLTWQQIRIGKRVSRSNLRRGDLVFTSPGHVQLYVGKGYIVEAANPQRGVVRRKMWGFMTARRP